MYKTSDKFNSAVCGDGRTFYARISDGTHEVTSGILSVKQTSRSVPDECITVGGAVSSYVEVEMIPPSFYLDNTELNVSIGMLIDGEKEWVPLGLFTVQKPKTDSGVVKFTAYDRIQSRMNGMYASELTYPCDGKKVLAEISKKTGVPVDTSNLPDGVMIPLRAVSTESTTDDSGNKAENTSYTAPFDGYTYREAVAYIAQLYGMFSTMDRAGNLAFRWYTASNFSVSASRYYDDLTLAETVFSVEKITCQAGNDTFSAGDGNVCISLENPAMTQELLSAVQKQVKGLEFLPASVSFLGDPRVDVGDIITVTNPAGEVVKIPVMAITQDFDGGLLTTVQSFGKIVSESEQKGPTAQKLDRTYTDLFLVKELVGTKASFDYVYGLDGNFKKLSGDFLSFKSGEFETLKAKQAEFENATIENLTASNARIDVISGDLADYKKVVTRELITAKGWMAEGAIGDAQISTLTANKIRAGTIDTSLVTVASKDGKLQISDNTIQIKDSDRVRVQMGKDESGDYTLAVWDAAGKLIWDALGATENTIQRKIIRDNVVADDANIQGYKLDINSVVRSLNGADETISSTIVQVGNKFLNVLLEEQNNEILAQGENLVAQAAQIKANQDSILLKVSTQKFESYQRNVDSHLSTLDSSITSMKGQIVLKVEQTDIDTTINKVQVGGRNLIRNSKTLVFDNYGFGSPNSTKYMDENGNTLTDENGNILIE